MNLPSFATFERGFFMQISNALAFNLIYFSFKRCYSPESCVRMQTCENWKNAFHRPSLSGKNCDIKRIQFSFFHEVVFVSTFPNDTPKMNVKLKIGKYLFLAHRTIVNGRQLRSDFQSKPIFMKKALLASINRFSLEPWKEKKPRRLRWWKIPIYFSTNWFFSFNYLQITRLQWNSILETRWVLTLITTMTSQWWVTLTRVTMTQTTWQDQGK